MRVVGCPIRGLTPVAIVLEDLDRCFDGDFTALSNYVLKICLSMKPCIGMYNFTCIHKLVRNIRDHFWPYLVLFGLFCAQYVAYTLEATDLEDLGRCFDGDFTALSNYVLKICLILKPCIGRYVHFYVYA